MYAKSFAAAALLLFPAMAQAQAGYKVEALPLEDCASLRTNLETRLGADAGFRLAISNVDADLRVNHNVDGLRCLLWMNVSVHHVSEGVARGPRAVADRLKGALGVLGWSAGDETTAFDINEPDAVRFARKKGGATCVANTTLGQTPTGDGTLRVEISCYQPISSAAR